MQKHDGERNAVQKATGAIYTKPTTLSMLVTGFVSDRKREFQGLTHDYCPLLGKTYLDQLARSKELIEDANLLTVHLALAGLCACEFRFVEPLFWFPLIMFWILWKAPAEICYRRRRLATILLEASDRELVTDRGDMALKIKYCYIVEFRAMAAFGTCDLGLYIHLMQIRSIAFANTQQVEGANSTVQSTADDAPAAGHGLISNRSVMAHKVNHTILTAPQLASWHWDAKALL